MKTIFYYFLFLFAVFPSILFAQEQVRVSGKVTDEKGNGIELANVAVKGLPGGTTTNNRGYYKLMVPADTTFELVFSFIGYQTHTKTLRPEAGKNIMLDILLRSVSTNLPAAEVIDQRINTSTLIRLDPRQAALLPTIGSGIEDLIKTLPGVSSNNELSSQYTVRGGNFDENLVYVNGIEIYRPFLIRSGQQEGLSFLNSRLVSSIAFSAGGFAAEYGDKLSSVLDITYKKPEETAASLSLSLLGAEMHVEGNKNKFTYLLGARYKTTSYILNALETKGAYRPDFTDIQSFVTYTFNPKWELNALAYYSRNKYQLIPESRQTDFGTFQEAYRLNIYFDGQEVDNYSTGMGALSLIHRPHKDLDLRLTASAYSTVETETYDIRGQYWIGRLETSLGSGQFGNVIQAQGVGTFIDHARNYFDAIVLNIDHQGTWVKNRKVLKWGARFQLQDIDDRMSEWELVDSAGFTLPRPVDQIGSPQPARPDLLLNQVARAHNQLQWKNANAFVQHSWTFLDREEAEYTLTAGLRANYWDYANELLLSPRASLSYKPNWQKRMIFRLATGIYNQSPFYREIRMFDGSLYADARSQKSFQVVLGSDLHFMAWNRPFVFTSEVYYKYLSHIIPYEVDNVRIRYYADQSATGYAAGLDLKVNGEFVKGIESWASLSLMKTAEDVKGDSYQYFVNTEGKRITPISENQTIADTVTVFPGMIPRPSDQRLQFSVFFQDYIPNYPTFRVHLRLIYGTKLPFGPPNSERYQQTRRMPDYRRVDIGFSKQLVGEHTQFKEKSVFRHIKNMWLSLEVFNLLQVNNTVSYIWIKDVNNQQYAVPNYLTSRQINLKLVAEF
ncbi:MAG: TonB-dependent receptor [Bacteroidales bacterium]|nr:TonB-dependent receptor [Bacteroidales bacterium]